MFGSPTQSSQGKSFSWSFLPNHPTFLNTWHSALFKWLGPDSGRVWALGVRVNRSAGWMGRGPGRNTWGPGGPKNTNKAKGEAQRQPCSWQAQAGFPLMWSLAWYCFVCLHLSLAGRRQFLSNNEVPLCIAAIHWNSDACKLLPGWQASAGGRLGLTGGVGRTLKEGQVPSVLNKEAETGLGVCTSALKTFYLEVGTIWERYTVIRSKMLKAISFDWNTKRFRNVDCNCLKLFWVT